MGFYFIYCISLQLQLSFWKVRVGYFWPFKNFVKAYIVRYLLTRKFFYFISFRCVGLNFFFVEPILSLWSLFCLCGAYFIFVETVGSIPETVGSIPETVGSHPETVVCFQKQLEAIQKQLCASRNSCMLPETVGCYYDERALLPGVPPPWCPSSLVSLLPGVHPPWCPSSLVSILPGVSLLPGVHGSLIYSLYIPSVRR